MNTIKQYWVAVLFVLFGFALAAAYYKSLPSLIPVHWNQLGEANNWMPKGISAFLLPLTSLCLSALLILLAPRASREPSHGSMYRIYPQVVAAFAALMAFSTFSLLNAALQAGARPTSHRFVAIGIFVIFMGNFLGKTTRNGIFGIRTPWTLASDEIWLRTHRVGGPLFVFAGCATVMGGLIGHGRLVMNASIISVAVVTVAYSYVLWRASQRSI